MKSEIPLVSVVIPTYNRPVYLKRSIQSVLEQTYSNIEIIVVDDNNPGTQARFETESVMKIYEEHPEVVYIKHDRNRNGSAARNTGWKAAHGKYITFLDDDDEIALAKIERQVLCLEALDDSWGACYTGYRLIKENGKEQISAEKRSGFCYVDALMRTMFMGSGSNLFLRKKVVDEIGGYDESFRRNQDIEFMVRVLEYYKIINIDEPLLKIYQQGKRERRSFEDIEQVTEHYLNTFSEKINNLSVGDRKRVISVISLERFRVAFYYKKYSDGFKILRDNHVSIIMIIKYLGYLSHRMITNKSYGFDGK
ncbi:putative glycosyltransferase EpsJ [Lachnospiraceae bacterium]|nr:putative glycosyltransferase EpsJ [Lachnospiraceae bacterium]